MPILFKHVKGAKTTIDTICAKIQLRIIANMAHDIQPSPERTGREQIHNITFPFLPYVLGTIKARPLTVDTLYHKVKRTLTVYKID